MLSKKQITVSENYRKLMKTTHQNVATITQVTVSLQKRKMASDICTQQNVEKTLNAKTKDVN